jgi:dipeptidyl aminopeptidase/acylaminoacyl peptidase
MAPLPTALISTPVPTITATSTVAAAPRPTLTPGLPPGFVMPTPTPALPDAVITTDNLAALHMLRTVGVGGMVNASVAPAAHLVAVATTAGLALFTLPGFQLVRFTPRAIAHVALSPDGRLVLADGDLLRVADGTSLEHLNGPDLEYRFSPDGQFIVALQGTPPSATTNHTDLSKLSTMLWRSADSKQALTIPGYAAAFRPDGQMLAVTTGTSVQLLRLPSGEPFQTFSLNLPVNAYVQDLAFSPDGARVVVLDDDGGLSLIDAKSGPGAARQIRGYTQIAISPDGGLLAAGGQGNVQADIWKVGSGAALHDIPLSQREFGNEISRLSFSPDGAQVIGEEQQSNRPFGNDIFAQGCRPAGGRLRRRRGRQRRSEGREQPELGLQQASEASGLDR